VSEDTAQAIRREALAAARGAAPVAVATIIGGRGAAQGAKLLARPDGTTAGTLGDAALDRAAAIAAVAALSRRPREAVRAVDIEGARLMIEVYEQPASLLVVGGGHIGLSLATIGAHTGFRVTLLDDREEYANAARFPMADAVICGGLAVELDRLPIDGSTYIVLVTRGHKQDELGLRHVVGSSAAYVGMIGSKRRVSTVLRHLREEGAPAEALGRVHTPIGIDIGAETPEEIAVSILAEIIAVRRGRETGPARRGQRS